ncbi:MAG: hypothetical protein ACYSW3_02045 [Planctomycetota bacterium]|jgi:hypothetical protein
MSKKKVNQWDAPSESSDKTYKVTEYDDDTWACGCPHWIYRRKECKHIRDAKDGYFNGNESKEYHIIPASVRQVTQHKIEGHIVKIYVPLIPFNKYGNDIVITMIYDLESMGVPRKTIREYLKYSVKKMPTKEEIFGHIAVKGRCVYDKWVDERGWTEYAYMEV